MNEKPVRYQVMPLKEGENPPIFNFSEDEYDLALAKQKELRELKVFDSVRIWDVHNNSLSDLLRLR